MIYELCYRDDMKTARTMTFEEALWQKIDVVRGDIPRSRFIEKIVINTLVTQKND